MVDRELADAARVDGGTAIADGFGETLPLA
jgi:ABC-type sugar transport system permease subunit